MTYANYDALIEAKTKELQTLKLQYLQARKSYYDLMEAQWSRCLNKGYPLTATDFEIQKDYFKTYFRTFNKYLLAKDHLINLKAMKVQMEA